MIMNIYTDLVINKRFACKIKSELLKFSQEYRVLAILRYLFPQKYCTMTKGESPDLQDCINGVGIEVISAIRKGDMKAENAFSNLRQAHNDKEAEKYIRIIKSSGYALMPFRDGKLAIGTTGTSNGEKVLFQESIEKKKAKIQQYRKHFKVLGLAVLLPEIPTLEAESRFVDWICEAFQKDNNSFDFIYVISHRFCIYYDPQKACSCKKEISKEEHRLLHTIARMTAEGELSLEDREWQ